MKIELPPITQEDLELFHYNPNTADIVERMQEYAKQAVLEERDRLAREFDRQAIQLMAMNAQAGVTMDIMTNALRRCAAAIRQEGQDK